MSAVVCERPKQRINRFIGVPGQVRAGPTAAVADVADKVVSRADDEAVLPAMIVFLMDKIGGNVLMPPPINASLPEIVQLSKVR